MSEVKEECTVVIDRSKWRTGHNSPENATGKGITRLTNGHGYSCCLGFICQQLMPDVEAGVWQANDFPNGTGLDIPHLTQKIDDGGYHRRYNTPFSSKAVRINDDTHSSVAEKEQQLLALVQKLKVPIKLKFVGEPTPYTEEKAKSE
jgi:hypothetical protein